ncbi:MAG: NHL repeat-containing protein, partial [Leptospira sp.]|nr:NHL repeat-containing protein [Leptospira sp.]
MSHNRRSWFLLTACSLLFLGLDFPKFKTGEERAFSDFQKALMHYNAREYSLSREKLLSVIAQKRDFPLAKLYLSRSLYQSGEWLDSLQVMEELNRSHPETSISSRLEFLQMEIARQKVSVDEMVFFKSLNGDENRGFRFRNPVDVAVDTKGSIYILSFGTGNLVSLHPNYEPKWMAQGGFARKMKGPLSMVLWEDKILVADFPTDHIYLFNTKGNYIDRFGGTGSDLSQFRGPSSVTRDNAGNFYIADTGNHRILKWNAKMEPLFAFGTTGKGKLSIPSGIQYNNGKIYALDKIDARIIVYDEEGNFIEDYKNSYLKKPRHVRFIKNSMVVSDEISGIIYMDLKTLEWSRTKPFQDKSGKIRNVDRPFSS